MRLARRMLAAGILRPGALPAEVMIDDCEVAWTGSVGILRSVSATPTGGALSPHSLLAYHAIIPGDLSYYSALKLWYKASAAVDDDDRWLVCLCSDADGRDVVDSFRLPAVASNTWAEVTVEPTGGGSLDGAYQSIALYTGGTSPAATTQFRVDGIRAVTSEAL